MRTQLMWADNDFLGAEAFKPLHDARLFDHDVPLLSCRCWKASAIFFIADDVGQRWRCSFPRLGVFSYFTFVMGGLLFYSSYLFRGARHGLVCLCSPGRGLNFGCGLRSTLLLALGVAEVAAIAAGVDRITILRMRALNDAGTHAGFGLGVVGDGDLRFSLPLRPSLYGDTLARTDRKFKLPIF
ncbi:MAG: hypothetical protein R2932_30740 [Caldilineaceae bacterium]